MSETSTTYPHQDKLAEYGIATADLSEKTQKKIAKFAAETDEENKETLDESIFGDIADFMEAKAAKEKAEKIKAERAAHKEKKAAEDAAASTKKKIDVSKAATATGSSSKKEDSGSFMGRMFGRE